MSNSLNDPRPAPTPRDLSGHSLGDYRVLRRLGRGAMAEVYLAEQLSLSRQVALKILKQDLAVDETYVKRFQREARAAAALSHANIVQIYDVGCVDGLYHISQEYVDGGTLLQWISRNGALELKTALVIMWQIAAALGKAAEAGIIHRDIKPENILFSASGEVKVADFGLARVPERRDGVNLTQIGMTLGTPLYMSPEQVEGKNLDPRSDLYSFGATCYHMLAGRPPFQGDTALSVAVQHVKESPTPLEGLRPDLPPALARIVHRMMEKKPEDRYQTPRQVQREIRDVQRKYLSEDWPEDIPDWNLAELDSADRTSPDAMRRLESLMKAETALKRSALRRAVVVWSLIGLGVFLVGAGLAYGTVIREASLLEDAASQRDVVPNFKTVGEQWLYAVQLDNEDAWLAVIDNFPEEKYWGDRARRQLARIYLEKEYDAKARETCELLVRLGDTEPELRTFGVAGLAYLDADSGDYRNSHLHLNDLIELREQMGPRASSVFRDPQISSLIERAEELLRENSDTPLDPNFERILRGEEETLPEGA